MSARVTQRRFEVRNIVLDSGEEVPVLVDVRSGVPPIVPVRWIVRQRRLAASTNTLRNDLQGIADLYEWAVERGYQDLDSHLIGGAQLNPRELTSLMDFVRERPSYRGGKVAPRLIETAAQRIASIETLLSWAADPYNRGSRTYIAPETVVAYKNRLEATFKPLRTAGGAVATTGSADPGAGRAPSPSSLSCAGSWRTY